MNYIKKHDVSKKDVYEYIKTKVDVQELINYYICQSFYANSDLFKRNIDLWKEKDGKWRWIMYDLDYAYSKYEQTANIFVNQKPNYNSSLDIVVKLYQNKEFKDLYLSSLAKYLKTTFKPSRVNKIIDELVSYHLKRWSGYSFMYGWDQIGSMASWNNSINTLKSNIKNRYNSIVKNLKSGFRLSNEEYKKYFSDL